MRAVLCEDYGPAENLVVKTVDDLTPGKRQVRIAVQACGVNFPDTLIIEGKYQFKPPVPFVPGAEVAGVIDMVGENVKNAKVGDRITAMALHGGYAEQMVVDETALLYCPTDMPAEVAAGFTMTYGTSMHALKQRAQLQPGETLLVLGAGGGVGLAAVEIGKAMGARVIAAASSDAKLKAAQDAGADHLINYTTDDLRGRLKEITKGQGVDVVYDPVGGDMFEQALRSTAWNGRDLVVGFASGDIPKVPANLALLKGCSIVGVFWGSFRVREADVDAQNFAELFDMWRDGKLKPLVSQTLPLEDAAKALTDLSNRRALGKIVLTTGQG